MHLFVTGGSGGGVLTAWIVGRTDRFKAAAAQKPVINWASEVADHGRLHVHGQVLVRQHAVGRSRRPTGSARRCRWSGKSTTPTLVVVGDKD